MMQHLVLAVGVLSAFGCGAEGSYDASEFHDEVMDNSGEVAGEPPDGWIDNGDGTFALPESWLENVVELNADPSAYDVVDKGAGTEVRSGVGPTIFSKNFTYTLTLPHGVAHFGPINNLPYTWSLGYIPAGLAVALCRNTTASCVSITGAQSGTVTGFNGQQSNVPMIFTWRVNGAGNLNPSAQGKPAQVIVNHT